MKRPVNHSEKINILHFLAPIIVLTTIIFSVKASILHAQEVSVEADSLFQKATADTVKSTKPKDGQLEGPIRYWADQIDLSYNDNTIYLHGNAKIEYQDMTLTAAFIKVDRNINTLYSNGILDSVDADGFEYYSGTPVFSEKGTEPMEGNLIEYNFDTKRGKITQGKTKMDPGYYKGSQINKISNKTLLVQTGYFTTCDNIDHPHFYFKSSKMRVKTKDKVVAKPIYFYIADVPVMALPFGIFPNKGGRQSGLVVPSYGESQAGGRFLRGIGYYWAPNDYFDGTFLTDYYDRLGFTFRGDFRYTLRYFLNGNLSTEYYPKDPSSGQRQERWRIRFNHSQTINPTLSISGSGSFQSDKSFSQDLSSNVNDRLNQNISSNLSVRKSWKGTKNSMTLSMSQTENLQTERLDYTLPSLSFNHSQSSIFESVTGKSLGSKRNWYQNIYYSYSGNLLHKGSHVPLNDSLETFDDTQKSGVRHQFNFTSPQKVLKYFNVSPSLNYTEDWVNEVTEAELDEETNQIIQRQKSQFAARRTFTSSLGVKTTMYGLFEPNIGELKAIRHKMDPSISMSYTPDFSSSYYGYYDTVTYTNGVEQKIDRFQNSAFGGTPQSESRRVNIQLANLFQAKLVNDEGKESKIDLFTLNFSTAYDFKKDSLNWSNLSTSFRAKILNNNLTVSASHTFYKAGRTGTGYRDEYIFSDGNFLPRLLNLSASYGYSLSNKSFAKDKSEDGPASRRKSAENGAQSESDLQNENQNEGILESKFIEQDVKDYMEETKKLSIPWTTSLTMNYSFNRSDINTPVERIDISARAGLQLTKNWKISWNARFDLTNHDITTQNFSIYRDLHCWEMSFDWQPLRDYYSFQINIKSSVLKDIKVTKHPSGSTYLPNY